jgi:hypothetical protein
VRRDPSRSSVLRRGACSNALSGRGRPRGDLVGGVAEPAGSGQGFRRPVVVVQGNHLIPQERPLAARRLFALGILDALSVVSCRAKYPVCPAADQVGTAYKPSRRSLPPRVVSEAQLPGGDTRLPTRQREPYVADGRHGRGTRASASSRRDAEIPRILGFPRTLPRSCVRCEAKRSSVCRPIEKGSSDHPLGAKP